MQLPQPAHRGRRPYCLEDHWATTGGLPQIFVAWIATRCPGLDCYTNSRR